MQLSEVMMQIVMEYCHCGSLAAFLGRGSRLNEDELRDISACSLLGLNNLHNLKVIHRVSKWQERE